MRIRETRLFTVTIIISMIILTGLPNQVRANGISIKLTENGYMFCFSSNTSLPHASVNISITCHDGYSTNESWLGFSYDFDMNSSFTVVSDVSKNETIAFAYPGDWERDEYSGMNMNCFVVKVDGLEVPYKISTLGDAVSNYTYYLEDEIDYDWSFLSNHKFVIFNASLIASKESILDVTTQMRFSDRSTYLILRYCVGTARAWKGNTRETVRIDVLKKNHRHGCEFFPNESLTASGDYFDSFATWDLDFETFTANHVGVKIAQRTTENRMFVYHFLIILIPLFGIIGVVIICCKGARVFYEENKRHKGLS